MGFVAVRERRLDAADGWVELCCGFLVGFWWVVRWGEGGRVRARGDVEKGTKEREGCWRWCQWCRRDDERVLEGQGVRDGFLVGMSF